MERIKENRKPTTTAEEEFEKISGIGGDRAFSEAFPPEQTQTHIEQAVEWDNYFRENESQMIAEMAISETMEKSKRQRIYFLNAINYLEESIKTEQILENARLNHIFDYVNNEAEKLLSQTHTIENPYNIGVLATLKSLIDLKQDQTDEDFTLLDIIQELNNRLEVLNKALKSAGVANL